MTGSPSGWRLNTWASLLTALTAACGESSGPNGGDPFVDYVFPGRISAGNATVVAQVVGDGFGAQAVALVNGSERITNRVDRGLLDVALTEADLASAGVLAIVVENRPGNQRSNAGRVEVFDTSGTIFSISPATAVVGGGGFPDTLFGRGFAPGTVVRVNGSARTTSVPDPTRVVVQITAQDLAHVGPLTLTAVVGNPPQSSNSAVLSVVADQRITAIATVPIVGRTMRASPAGDRLYVAVANATSSDPDSIAVVDPSSGAVERYFLVTPETKQLEVSGDGRHLYVISATAPTIDRIDLVTSAVQPIALPDHPTAGPTLVNDLAIMPGRSSSFVASLSDPLNGVVAVVYDGDQPRPRKAGVGGVFMEATDRPTEYYGASGGTLYRLVVRPDGILVSAVFEGLSELGLGEIQYGGGARIVATDGAVFDLAVGRRVGSLALPIGAPRVDRARRRVYFLQGNESRLRASDLDSFGSLGGTTVSGVADLVGPLERWGSDGLAFFDRDRRLVLVRTTLVTQ